jgi:hypothetical protein
VARSSLIKLAITTAALMGAAAALVVLLNVALFTPLHAPTTDAERGTSCGTSWTVSHQHGTYAGGEYRQDHSAFDRACIAKSDDAIAGLWVPAGLLAAAIIGTAGYWGLQVRSAHRVARTKREARFAVLDRMPSR